ncbi:MAG: T9SS type A sorting domain-containing protein [Pseudoflavonifractor sp.]|nr:T9SS type A sorting domain-containing protein [Pseudoflavonifractor sp.]
MRKLYLSLLTLLSCLPALAQSSGDQASITSNPSPAVTTKALEVKIQTGDFGGDVYCHTWAVIDGEDDKPAAAWGDGIVPKLKMTGSGGSYTIKVDDIKSFYGLSDTQLEKTKKLGFIARTAQGRQCQDCFVEVVQGRQNAYGGGEGTQDNPFVLNTAAHLTELASTPMDWSDDTWLKLGADINLQSITPIGSKGSPYKGHFDGGGHTVKGAVIVSETLGSAAGLFGAIDGADIHDLGVVGVSVSGSTFTGGLVGYVASGNVSRCFVTGNVRGASICAGGIAGENHGTISDCYAAVDVTNPDDYATGGIVGKNLGVVKNVYATGEVSGKGYVGGVVGANYGTVSNSAGINKGIGSSHNYVARFGGNNNPRNNVNGNLAWGDMVNTSNPWTQHGDHAEIVENALLTAQNTYQNRLGWDFSNVWEWKSTEKGSLPLLRNISGQTNVMPENIYASSGIGELVTGSAVNFNVYPNPVSDVLHVTSADAIITCDLYSLIGARVVSMPAAGESDVDMELGSVPAGVYMLRVVTAGGSEMINKIIKK